MNKLDKLQTADEFSSLIKIFNNHSSWTMYAGAKPDCTDDGKKPNDSANTTGESSGSGRCCGSATC